MSFAQIGDWHEMAKEPLAWRDAYESICVTLAVIVLFTWRCSCSAAEPIPVRQMLAQQLNRRKRKGDATRRDATWHGTSFPLRECDCGCSIDARRHYAEARMNRDKRKDEEMGKCFRVPLARSHCYLTRTTRWRPANGERQARTRKGKHCWENFRQMPFSLGSLHVCLISLLGVLIIEKTPTNYTFDVSPIRFFSCGP